MSRVSERPVSLRLPLASSTNGNLLASVMSFDMDYTFTFDVSKFCFCDPKHISPCFSPYSSLKSSCRLLYKHREYMIEPDGVRPSRYRSVDAFMYLSIQSYFRSLKIDDRKTLRKSALK